MKLHEQLTEWYYTHDAVQSGGVKRLYPFRFGDEE